MRNSRSRPPLPSRVPVSLDPPPFAERFETDRLYRIQGEERRLFCALASPLRDGLAWNFHPRLDFVTSFERYPRNYYSIRSGNDPERVVRITGYADWNSVGEDTDLDWRAFVPTDYVREGQRWRVYRPLVRANGSRP